MHQRVIIAGGGRVGARAATILGDHGHDPVVIEQDANRCERLTDSRKGVVIEGDATRPAIIAQTDPDRADAFAALTGDAAQNLRLCEQVKTMTDGIRTVARVDDRSRDPTAADRTVVPAAAGAKAAASEILEYGQGLRALPATGFDVVKVEVDPRAPAARKQLADVQFPGGAQVVADAQRRTLAGPETELRPDRRYILAVEPAAAADVRNLLRG